MVRPEELELSTFWFVERQEGQTQKSISFVWRRLRIGDVALPFFNCTQSCTRAIHSAHLTEPAADAKRPATLLLIQGKHIA